jgi:hypothetical protein
MVVLGAAAVAGCDSPSALSGSEISAIAGGGSIGVLLLTPATGCLAQAAATSYFIDGMPMTAASACGAGSGQLSEDRSFVIEVRNHGDRAEMIVADMFPGMKAALVDPADGKVAPGGTLTVAVPAVLQYASPYVAHFVYTDDADAGYVADNFFFPAQPGVDVVTLVAPTHAGHFQLQILMETNDPSTFAPGRVVSCSGVAKCSAQASSDLGPIPVEVAP